MVAMSDPADRSHSLKNSSPGLKAVLVAAVLVGLAGLGVGIYALVNGPVKQGQAGAQGPAGQTGKQGEPGKQGPAGPAGSLSRTTIVNGTAVVSAPNPAPGTVVVARTMCPMGDLLLSGGGQVSAPSAASDRNVGLRDSFPLSPTVWQTVGITNGPLGPDETMTLRPFVVCGVK